MYRKKAGRGRYGKSKDRRRFSRTASRTKRRNSRKVGRGGRRF